VGNLISNTPQVAADNRRPCRIGRSATRVVTEWGLENKVDACTFDNVANIVGGVILCNWRHIRCFPHLVVQRALKEIQEVRDKIKDIVGHFKRSSQTAARSQPRQEQLQFKPTLTVIQNVVTHTVERHI